MGLRDRANRLTEADAAQAERTSARLAATHEELSEFLEGARGHVGMTAVYSVVDRKEIPRKASRRELGRQRRNPPHFDIQTQNRLRGWGWPITETFDADDIDQRCWTVMEDGSTLQTTMPIAVPSELQLGVDPSHRPFVVVANVSRPEVPEALWMGYRLDQLALAFTRLTGDIQQ